MRIMERFGISREEGYTVSALILERLAAGPLARPAINAAVRPKVSKRVRNWMDKVWSILRIPFAEGLVCYGPEENNQVTFVRSDHWLPRAEPVPESAAQIALLRKYLGAYGPANVHDFSHWAGLPMSVSRKTFSDLKEELCEVSVSGEPCAILQEDLPLLTLRNIDRDSVRLLPLFDPYLLAHAEKYHLVEQLHYKRVYRNQGWISAVILRDGKIAGTWSYVIEGKKIVVQITPFKRLPTSIRKLLEFEAATLSAFLGKEVEMQYLSLATT